MTRHLQREIDAMKQMLLTLCAMVEKSVVLATRAIAEQDEKLAQTVMDGDSRIDSMEVEIEEECLKILALHQPVAVDLRAIVAVLKINNDLERIGDLAVNVAERARFLATRPALPEPFDFSRMAGQVRAMLTKAVDAFVEGRSQEAHEVCAADDDVDGINRAMYRSVEALLGEPDADIPALMHLLSVSRDLERIADHATNIAEDVIYMIAGEIVRHHVEDYTKGQ